MHPLNRILDLFGIRVSRVKRGADGNGRTRADEEPAPVPVGPFLVEMPEGKLRYVYGLFPEYNSELTRVARPVHAKYPDMIAVDVGAHIGDTAARIREACPASIVCVEGDLTLLDTLRRNADQLGGLTIRTEYLSDRTETCAVKVTQKGSNSTLVPSVEGPGTESVRFTTLDELLNDADRRRVKLLKIDTEGFDGKVLRGGPRLLAESRPIILFEINRENLGALGEDGLATLNLLKGFGYSHVLIWDGFARFLLATTLDQTDLIRDLLEYTDFRETRLFRITYLDICVFHPDDADLAAQCVELERRHRRTTDQIDIHSLGQTP